MRKNFGTIKSQEDCRQTSIQTVKDPTTKPEAEIPKVYQNWQQDLISPSILYGTKQTPSRAEDIENSF